MSEPSKVSVVGPDGGEQIHLGPVRTRILEDGSSTSHRLGISESVLPPHTPGPPQHRHARHDEAFYIVSGTAVFTVGDTNYEAPAGTLVMVPPGAPHSFANPGDEPVVMISTFTPRPVRSVLQGHERNAPERNDDAADPYRGDAPIRHRAGDRIRLTRAAASWRQLTTMSS
jgi:mannose-6-phosphate isomerase-like protein (cupin superfamily)